MLEITPYKDEHQAWFEELNRRWIEEFFWMEPIDEEVLQHPDKHILGKGGAILMAVFDKEIAGTVALKLAKPGVYEFTKMAVSEKYRGQQIGKALALAAIEKAKDLGARKVILYSNTKLKPAISLYRKLGFIEVPVDGPYARSDIKMELALHEPATLSIRNATLQDAALLTELGIRTFEDTFAMSNTAGDMKLYLEKNFTVARLQCELTDPASTFLLVYDGETAAGYAKLRKGPDPDELKGMNSTEIERLYVVKEYLGRRAGQALMQACLDCARDEGFDTVWLGVWEHNARAIAFYEKIGFTKFSAHPFLLGTDLQTDLMMMRKL